MVKLLRGCRESLVVVNKNFILYASFGHSMREGLTMR